MEGPDHDELAFERTFHLLVVPGDALALDTTIRSRTLAATATVRDGATLETPGPTVEVAAAPSSLELLPRLSVGEGGGAEPRVAAGPGPDLTVTGLLGEGGMGRVELARQRSLDRDVALKRPRGGTSAADATALRHEALITGSLEHPNIVPIHALGRDDAGRPIIVMKRVEGVAWRALIHDRGHPGWASREPDPSGRLVFHLGVLAQVCNAVAFAHQRGLVHRDIKPDNVMIGEFGEVYLVDWGLAAPAPTAAPRADEHVALVGTPAYLAPEMVAGGPCDARTDVFLLGATLHEVLTRRVRHDGGDLRAVLRQAFAAAPFAYGDDVPAELGELANRATARDPAARPPSALEFRQHLLEHLRHRGSTELCATADGQLAELEAGAARDPSATGLERGLDECRFAYRQALATWPDNLRAQRGLERCAVARVRLEVARGNAPAARAALHELAAPAADLVAAVAAVEAAHADALAERERLRQLDHDADPGIAIGSRLIVLLVLGLAAMGLSAYASKLELAGSDFRSTQLVGYAAALFVGAAIAIGAWRRRLLTNAYNRRLAAWFVVIMGFLVANRALGLWLGATPQDQLADDLLTVAAMISAGSVFAFRGSWLPAVPLLAGMLVSAARPDHAFLIFALASGASLLTLVVVMPRRAR